MWQYESQQASQPDHGGDQSCPNTMSHPKNKTFLASQTCSNKHAIGFSNHKHTPITATQKEPCSLGASVSLSPPHTRTNRTELAFVLARPGRNPVLWTSFPAGQRDITLDQPNPATQIRTPQRPREPHHTTTAGCAEQLYSSPVAPAQPPISPSIKWALHCC